SFYTLSPFLTEDSVQNGASPNRICISIAGSNGWQEYSVTDPAKFVLEYKTEIVKLKAKCISKCHTRFVDRSCTASCSK
ncbi:hypothetical protein PENTCL1PPCAC_18497, partial [Pristionchus entomophagus]